MKRSDLTLLALAAIFATASAAVADEFTAASEGNKAKPATVAVDFAADCGPVKPMNAVNNGPVGGSDAVRHGNFTEYMAANIPFARTHDASEYIVYGGDHVADVTAMFPNFDADENDPKNYDFTVTDAYLKNMRAAGTEPFFRLGQRIEHAAKRYNIWPPKDYAKWARICEHIIRHYNRGWANGHRWSIRYWEIWNEPDIDWNWEKKKGLPNMWGGTPEEFFRFYEIAAKHLKGKFPELMIGGPAIAGNTEYGEMFLKYQHEHGTPIDFFSWHIYTRDPHAMVRRALKFREIMDRNGYGSAESHLNEWNYVKGWEDAYHYSITQLAGQKGGAFTAAGMIAMQHSPVDMLMYYDAKPDAHFNGMFDKTTLRPLPAYYAIYAWGRFAKCARAAKADSDTPDIYAAAARGEGRKRALFVARYADDENFAYARNVTIRLAGGMFPKDVALHVTDADRRHTEMTIAPKSATELRLKMDPQSFVLVEYEEPEPASKNSFVAASFNIRIDIDKGEHAWPGRKPLVAEVIRKGRFQLIGFQEVTRTMWPDLVAELSEYRFADGPDKQGPNPIAYRPDVFERIDSGRFALSENPADFKTVTWGSSGVRVCQWALLRHKTTGRLIRMFNQHPDWKSMEQRVKGMGLVAGKIKAAKANGELVILTGDMNDEEGNCSIHTFAPFDKRYPVGESIRIAKSVLNDSFDISETVHAGPVESCHGYKPVSYGRYDDIFVSDGFRVISTRTHADRPGGKYPSDHDAFSARIDFK